jgi:crotonobetainyl-CoA:carnitine CoA-transferase CaiB-like acyl-CoA transferase
MGQPALADDPRYATVAARMSNVDSAEALVSAWLADLTTEQACVLLDKAGVPYSEVADIQDAATNEQLLAREMIIEVEHKAGKVVVPGVVVKLSETPGSVREAPPVLGQHTDEVLTGLLGLSADEVSALRAEGVV